MSKKIINEIISRSFRCEEGAGALNCVSSLELERIASSCGTTRRELSILALENNIVPIRYLKNIGTLGIKGQIMLLRSKVAVIGAGGLGSRVAEILARSGVGEIALADPDVYEESNLNRQAFSAEDKLGIPKLSVVKECLGKINKDVEVHTYECFATESNLEKIINGAGVVIDALDNIEDRLTLEEACASANVPLVHGAIAGSYLQISTVYPEKPGLRHIYGITSESGNIRGIEEETGNPAVTPVIASAIQANESIRILTGKRPLFKNKLLFIDLEEMVIDIIDFS